MPNLLTCFFIIIFSYAFSPLSAKISSAKDYLPLPSSSHQRSSSVQIKQLRQAGWLNKMKNTMQSKKRFYIITVVLAVLLFLLWVFVPNNAYQPFNSNKSNNNDNGKLNIVF